jgi:hypothetical protein
LALLVNLFNNVDGFRLGLLGCLGLAALDRDCYLSRHCSPGRSSCDRLSPDWGGYGRLSSGRSGRLETSKLCWGGSLGVGKLRRGSPGRGSILRYGRPGLDGSWGLNSDGLSGGKGSLLLVLLGC